jgi:hypothetical protein
LCIRFWPQLQGLPLRYVKLHRASSGMWVANPKIKEDSGIHDLKVKNRALLGKWRFELLTEDRVQKTLLNRKYLPKCFVQSFLDPWDSYLLAGLMATKKYFFPYGSFIIKDGSKIRIWEDLTGYHYTSKTTLSFVQHCLSQGHYYHQDFGILSIKCDT